MGSTAMGCQAQEERDLGELLDRDAPWTQGRGFGRWDSILVRDPQRLVMGVDQVQGERHLGHAEPPIASNTTHATTSYEIASKSIHATTSCMHACMSAMNASRLPHWSRMFVATASKESSITHAVVGRFTKPTSLEILVGKGTRLDGYQWTGGELIPWGGSFPTYGRVVGLKTFKGNDGKDFVLVVTSRGTVMVGGWGEGGNWEEKGYGELGKKGVGESGGMFCVAVEPRGRVAVVHMALGRLSLVALETKTGAIKEVVDVSLEESDVVDLCFVGTSGARPLLAVLFEDSRNARHVKTFEINLRDRSIHEGSFSQPHVDFSATTLISVPEPLGGLLVLSSTSVSYLDVASSSVITTSGAGNQTPGASGAPFSSRPAPHTGLGVGGVSASPMNPTTTTTTGTTMTTGAARGVTIPVYFGQIKAVGQIDENGSRWLMGDEIGGLHVLALVNQPVTRLTFDLLGETSAATALCYLTSGVVFVGSAFGDSQLVRLPDPSTLPSGAEDIDDGLEENGVEVLATFPNLGPIVDAVMVDVDRQGRGQLVTCSGNGKDGSLRVVRNGVGIDVQADIELPGIKGIWSLRVGLGSPWDAYIVQSFSTETRVLGLLGETELAEITSSLLALTVPTLHAGSLRSSDTAFQITPDEVRVFPNAGINLAKMARGSQGVGPGLVWRWSPPHASNSTRRITVACSHDDALLLALTQGTLVKLEISPDEIGNETATRTLEHEISALSLSSRFAVVGLWSDLSVRVLDAQNLTEIHREQPGDTLPRSVATFAGPHTLHLLCGLGDGTLVVFTLDPATGRPPPSTATSAAPRRVVLGTQPVELSSFVRVDKHGVPHEHAFAASDRPIILYHGGPTHQKLLLSNVNVSREVTHATAFNSETFPGCLALATEEGLVIGTLNDVQRLHVRKVALGESPRRLVHHQASETFAVLTMGGEGGGEPAGTGVGVGGVGVGVGVPVSSEAPANAATSPSNQEFPGTCFVRILDDRTFEVCDSFRLDEMELAMSVASCRFVSEEEGGSAPLEYVVVGTAYILDEEAEPSKGRVLVFLVERGTAAAGSRKLVLVGEKGTRGGVYSLRGFHGKLLAAINAKVQMFRWGDKGGGGGELVQDCGYFGHTLTLALQTEGDIVAVADLMKSVSLVKYDAGNSSLEELSRDFNANWMSALAMLDPTLALGADASCNLFYLKYEADAPTEEERARLRGAGEMQWGDFINVICKGSLVMPPSVAAAAAGTIETTASSMTTTTASSTTTKRGGDASSATLTITSPAEIRPIPRFCFGTVGGALGIIATLTPPEFALLSRVQDAMYAATPNGKRQSEFRAFHNDRHRRRAHGFVDGDLLAQLLEMRDDQVAKVVEVFNAGLTREGGDGEGGQGGEKNGTGTTTTTTTMMSNVTTNDPKRLTASELLSLVEELNRLV